MKTHRSLWLLALSLVTWIGGCAGEGPDGDVETITDALIANGVDVTLGLSSDWTAGYCAEVTLQNTSSAPVSSWTVVVDLNQSTMANLWNGTFTQSGSRITVRPMDYNASIAPGGSADFGFCANATGGNYRPTLVSVTIAEGDDTGGTGGTSGTGGGSSTGGSTSTGGSGPGCPSGRTLCSGQCVNTSSSSQHCGSCNNACTGKSSCISGSCQCPSGQTSCVNSCVDTQSSDQHCGACGNSCSDGQSCSGGTCTGGGSNLCDPGTPNTTWASSCRTSPVSCTPGVWMAPRDGGETRAPLRFESEHFAFYWPNGTNITLAQAQNAANTLEMIWSRYFGSPIFFPEPYCNSSQKWKAAVHFDNGFPLWGGGWSRNGISYMGMWVGPGAANDPWGLAHEFMHGVQSSTQGFPDCGGVGCWIYESHANWMPHQIWRDNVHCSDMLVNAPHLYYGSTRNRYCNWQFFEYLKDKHCYSAVNEMWTYQAPAGQRDPWQKLMLSRGWNIEQLNDLFGEWAMHNITWDYKNPPPTDGSNQGSIYRARYGSIEPVMGASGRTDRRLRLTRLEALDSSWASNRRFVSPYHWAPQRWGYNVVRLHPEQGATSVRVTFRGVIQGGANSGWRWGLVATNSSLTSARYSELQRGTDGDLTFCITPGENLYLVVVATPTQHQKITWTNPSDGPAYPSIYRYPYMVQLQGAWPAGFQNGQLEACPSGTVRHPNGGGCAPSGTPGSVYVGPYAKILGGNVSGSARIEDHATVLNGTITGGRIGALSLVGQGGSGIQARGFNVSGSAVVQSTFYPLSWFGSNKSVGGTARLLGDIEFVATSKSNNTFYGLVTNEWNGVSSASEVTLPPPYTWRN